MDAFTGWAVTVCTAAVVCTLLQWLFPATSIGMQGRRLLPCVFVCVLLTPLLGITKTLQLPTFFTEETVDTQALQARLHQQTVQQVNAALLAMANQALQSYGYVIEKVVTDMDIADDGSIHMGQITMYMDENTARHSAAVRQIVERRLGTPVVLARWEESG